VNHHVSLLAAATLLCTVLQAQENPKQPAFGSAATVKEHLVWNRFTYVDLFKDFLSQPSTPARDQLFAYLSRESQKVELANKYVLGSGANKVTRHAFVLIPCSVTPGDNPFTIVITDEANTLLRWLVVNKSHTDALIAAGPNSLSDPILQVVVHHRFSTYGRSLQILYFSLKNDTIQEVEFDEQGLPHAVEDTSSEAAH